MNARLPLPVLVCLPLVASLALAAEPTPQQIARNARDRGALNLRDLSARLKLTTTRDGHTRTQVLQTQSREIGGRMHSLARFLEPATVSGVTVLTVEGQGEAADDISIYLPRLKRVRKVAQSQRGQAFMDTDFSYADLGGLGGEESRVQRLDDQKIQGRDAYVLTGAANPASPYGKVTLYVDKQTWVPLQVDYTDKDGKPFKRYRTLSLKKFQERVLAAKSVMENLQTGSKTEMEILSLEPSTAGDDAYTERALERG